MKRVSRKLGIIFLSFLLVAIFAQPHVHGNAPADYLLLLQCEQECEGKECGDDGCGGSCGNCAPSDTCINGQCVCVPTCAGKECGDDGAVVPVVIVPLRILA